MSSIPKIIFGKCPRCGGTGGDAPASSLTPADSQSNIVEVGNGYVLKYVDGELMCEICEKEYFADIEGEEESDKHDDEESFRAKAGFRKTIT